jgi:hypothetical protein
MEKMWESWESNNFATFFLNQFWHVLFLYENICIFLNSLTKVPCKKPQSYKPIMEQNIHNFQYIQLLPFIQLLPHSHPTKNSFTWDSILVYGLTYILFIHMRFYSSEWNKNIHNFQYILSFYYIQLLPHSSEFFSFWIKNEKNSEQQPTKVMETDHVCVCMGEGRLWYAPK